MNHFDMAYTVLGGLGVFILGMKYLSESLQAIASDFIRKVINWLTTNRLIAVLVGTLITCIIQSSSITTVMVVGMVNAGLMNLTQAIGVIFGANIGTTITGWIIAIKIGKYGLLFIALGFAPMLFSKNDNWKALGKFLVALGLVFFGLELMSDGLKPLRSDQGFLSLLHHFSANSYLSLLGCILIGCSLTCIVQSSSAMLGITIALASTGVITFQTAMALVLGENIGTTITAILASVGANTNAKRAARAHASFNLLGVFVMTLVFWSYVGFIEWLIGGDANFINAAGDKPYIAAHIAAGHSVFNMTATIIFLPFIKYLARFVTWITPGEDEEPNRLISLLPSQLAPAIGLEQADKEVERMMIDLKLLLDKTRQYLALDKDDSKLLDDIVAIEDRYDNDQKDVTVFVCKVMESPLTPEQSALGYALIRTSSEIESVSDYCAALAKMYKKTLKYKERALDETARAEFLALLDANIGFFAEILDFYKKRNINVYKELEIKNNQISKYADRVRGTNLDRVRTGQSTPFSGLAYSDMVRATRRIRNHAQNIADAMASAIQEFKVAG